MSDSWYAQVEMAAHLRHEHGWTWVRLREHFKGVHWDTFRNAIESKNTTTRRADR